MDKVIFKEKIDAMMPDLIEGIRKECISLYESGGIDVKQFGNDYQLPKLILTVALENQSTQYTPLSPTYKKDLKNLKHF
jgi:hypothetical protein